MAIKNTQAKRITPKKMAKAATGLTSLMQLRDYSPMRKEFSPDNASALERTYKETGAAWIAAQNALDKARDAAVAAEWAVHNFMQGAEEQVVGQYGSNSDEYASIGYKKKSEYKKGRAAGSRNKPKSA